jgi:hypothetical protein
MVHFAGFNEDLENRPQSKPQLCTVMLHQNRFTAHAVISIQQYGEEVELT